MTKVLIITPEINKYREDFYCAIAKEIDLTICHSGKKNNRKNIYKEIILRTKKLLYFRYTSYNLFRLCAPYEVVIMESNIRHIDRLLLIINPFRKYKIIFWGIGVSSSYKKNYDADNRFDWLRSFIYNKVDAVIFYSIYPQKKYISKGLCGSKIFVANNTVEVKYSSNKMYKKKHFLFVGSLYPEKKIFDLLENYLLYSKMKFNIIPLIIIGEGNEYDNIKNWINHNRLNEKVILFGPEYNHLVLEKYFREAFLCISPGQAGLSVLTSMGYGTPFVTHENAITGGELFNISNNENGIIYSNYFDLLDILIDVHNNENKYISMGKNARRYYEEKCTIQIMANEFIGAINYVLK